MAVEDDGDALVVVVGVLTKHDVAGLVREHSNTTFHFCTTEVEAESLGLELAWAIPTAVWCATTREHMPLYLARVIDQAERIGIPVIPCPTAEEHAV